MDDRQFEQQFTAWKLNKRVPLGIDGPFPPPTALATAFPAAFPPPVPTTPGS
ncbi:MAG: hypothetical protein ABIT71_15730 [Vicinamibacteraceae bacterium]